MKIDISSNEANHILPHLWQGIERLNKKGKHEEANLVGDLHEMLLEHARKAKRQEELEVFQEHEDQEVALICEEKVRELFGVTPTRIIEYDECGSPHRYIVFRSDKEFEEAFGLDRELLDWFIKDPEQLSRRASFGVFWDPSFNPEKYPENMW